MIAIGIGGVHANEIDEVEFVLPQISDQKINELSGSKVGKLIISAGGNQVFDEIVGYAIKLGKFMVANKNIKDIDLNPVIIAGNTAIAADFKIFVE